MTTVVIRHQWVCAALSFPPCRGNAYTRISKFRTAFCHKVSRSLFTDTVDDGNRRWGNNNFYLDFSWNLHWSKGGQSGCSDQILIFCKASTILKIPCSSNLLVVCSGSGCFVISQQVQFDFCQDCSNRIEEQIPFFFLVVLLSSLLQIADINA